MDLAINAKKTLNKTHKTHMFQLHQGSTEVLSVWCFVTKRNNQATSYLRKLFNFQNIAVKEQNI
jgi:hypothetical protein